ncbi:MAG: hypothetical protein AUK47_15165 [Deltaproteobacteria bacterium CG2_30_63_29]|nr:MAG: hypothetical protein AUK47_15165 [Deltaproteobacteria bacterium CG2_30_63_29]
MIRKLSPIGDQMGFIIDPSILELLRIDGNTALEVSTDGEALTIRPIRPKRLTRTPELDLYGDDYTPQTSQALNTKEAFPREPSVSRPQAEYGVRFEAPTEPRGKGPTLETLRTEAPLERPQSNPTPPQGAGTTLELEATYACSGSWKELVVLYERQGEKADWERLVDILRRMVRTVPEKPEKSRILLGAGQICEQRLNFLDRAMDLYQDAFKTDPNNVPALVAARSIYTQQRNWKMVQTLYRLQLNVSKDRKEQAAVHLELAGVFLREVHDEAKGIEALKEALKLDPENLVVRRLLATV